MQCKDLLLDSENTHTCRNSTVIFREVFCQRQAIFNLLHFTELLLLCANETFSMINNIYILITMCTPSKNMRLEL